VVKYVYDAWGRVLSTTGSLASTLGTHQPFRYRGYVYDVETGLYYLRSRYYNPTWQRFISSDSIICENVYSYCHNNPINRNDITGKSDVRFDDLDDTNDWLSERTSGGFGGFSDYGIRVPDISSTYYSQLNVRNSDSVWVNSPYNIGYIETTIYYIPPEAYEMYDYLINHNFTPPKGYKGGGSYLNDGRNDGGILPSKYAPYKEYDIYPRQPHIKRGVERIVIGGNGMCWYTNNHYVTFTYLGP